MALTFVDNASNVVQLGTSAHLRDITAGTMIVRAFPTTYPPASFRYIYRSNDGGGGNRTFDIGGSGGTLGPRFIIERTTSNLGIGATTANTPHSAVNTWCDWAATWDLNGADTDQHMYGGNLSNPFTEVTTYAAALQVVGSGTSTESTSADPTIGGMALGQLRGFPGPIAWFLFFNRQLSIGELRALQHRPYKTADCIGFWHLYGTGTQPDLSGHLDNGTVTGATASAHPQMGVPFGRAAGWRGAFTAAAAAAINPALIQWWGGRGNGFAFGRDPRAGKPKRPRRRPR
jgi:hypothetical protein